MDLIGLKRLAASVLFALIAGCGDDESEGTDLVTVDSVADVGFNFAAGMDSTDHPGHLYGGSCSAIGSVLEPLDTVSTDSTGVGSMTTNVPITRAEVAASQSVVVYFTSSGTPLVCAELPIPAGMENSTTL